MDSTIWERRIIETTNEKESLVKFYDDPQDYLMLGMEGKKMKHAKVFPGRVVEVNMHGDSGVTEIHVKNIRPVKAVNFVETWNKVGIDPFKVIVLDIESVAMCKDYKSCDEVVSAHFVYDAQKKAKKEGVEATPKYLAKKWEERGGVDSSLLKIVCISLAFFHVDDDGAATIRTKSYYGDEEQILKDVFQMFEGKNVILAGQSLAFFDCRVMWQKAAKYFLKPPMQIGDPATKPWLAAFLEIQRLFAGPGKFLGGLAEHCALFGIPSPKDGIDGSEVYQFYYSKKKDIVENRTKIVKYCENDVIATLRCLLWHLRIHWKAAGVESATNWEEVKEYYANN